MILRATEVFTPGAFPERTYVERGGTSLEGQLGDALATPGQVVSIMGPSKSGKTVLVEKVVGRDQLITITGAGLRLPEDIWTRVLDWMGAPHNVTHTAGTSSTVGGELSAVGGVGLAGLAKVDIQGSGKVELANERGNASSLERRGLSQVVKEIGNSDFVVLLDDFHYMPRDIQAEAAKSLKEAARLGVKICTASVPHRGDDLVRANPELRGRVSTIDLKYWTEQDLLKIASFGFTALNVGVAKPTLEKLVKESAGSPQLMQLLCLNLCFRLNVRVREDTLRELDATREQLDAAFEQTSSSTDFRSLVDVLDAGPRTRGVERKIYDFQDGSRGDVYRCVLKAVAANPPKLTFSYSELTRRTEAICKGDSPIGSSIVGTCSHMSRLALDKFPNERALDWDEQKQILDIPDPYLAFYLRWSPRLMQGE